MTGKHIHHFRVWRWIINWQGFWLAHFHLKQKPGPHKRKGRLSQRAFCPLSWSTRFQVQLNDFKFLSFSLWFLPSLNLLWIQVRTEMTQDTYHSSDLPLSSIKMIVLQQDWRETRREAESHQNTHWSCSQAQRSLEHTHSGTSSLHPHKCHCCNCGEEALSQTWKTATDRSNTEFKNNKKSKG